MEVIKTVYKQTYSLREFVDLHSVFGGEGSDDLISFLDSSVVGSMKPITSLNNTFNTNVCGTMVDVLLFVIKEEIKNGNIKQNILTLGYRVPTVPMSMEALNSLNSAVTFLRSRVVEELHRSLGSDLMVYLLRNLALFVKIGQSYVQVSGKPVNDEHPGQGIKFRNG